MEGASATSDRGQRRTSKSSGGTSDLDQPGRLLQSLKRQTVPTACDNCRSKKVKCDGTLPCGYCTRRALQCSFETTVPTETPQQARKRKHQEIAHRNEDFHQLYAVLAGHDEARANDIYARIRRGENLESLFDHIQHGGVPQIQPSTLDQRLRRIFLFSLIESTATLQLVADTSHAFMENNRINIPSADRYDPLRDRVVTIDALSNLLSDANGRPGIEGSPTMKAIENIQRTPIFWVPARPWLSDTSDQEASHLVSLFLCFLNHSWRFVEPQPFLNDMRSGNVSSKYCSPFLLNAMMALASLNSDLSDESFQPGHRPEKGMRYHNEAIRLWGLAESEPSITNIQGLTILALECLIRGKDQQGLGYLTAASTMNRLLPLPQRSETMSAKDSEYFVVRGCVWWMAVHVDLTYKVGLMLGGDDTDWDSAPILDDVLPDSVVYWTGYPFKDEPVPVKPNMIFLYQCGFTRLLWEATKILIWNATELDGRRQHAESLRDLTERLEYWYDTLPVELHFAADMPPSLYDLHVQYHCIMMALHERTYTQMFGAFGGRVVQVEHLSSEESATLETYLRVKALKHCYDGASLIRTFRETYGLKCISFILLNHSVLGVFVCLNDIHANPELRFGPSNNHTGPVQDTVTALEEFFRISLATSLRWPLSHGFALTAYNTATVELQIQLTDPIIKMVDIMAGIAWRSSDLSRLGSTHYPNWSMPHVKQSTRVEEFRMGSMLKKWEDLGVGQGGAEVRPTTSNSGTVYDPVRDQ